MASRTASPSFCWGAALGSAASRFGSTIAEDNGTITDLTALLETDFEGRALLEVAMVFADSYTDTVPLIEHVTGTGTVDPGSYTVPLQADKP